MSATAQVAGQTVWDADAIAASVKRSIRSLMGKRWHDATPRDLFVALALACREMLIEGWFATQDRVRQADAKRLYYLSVEFLIGRSLQSYSKISACSTKSKRPSSPSVDWESLVDSEPDAALGNGGLGRLAACFLDALASQDLPGFGYGINYDYGLFRQTIEDGQQREHPERWRRPGAAWLLERPERACLVPPVTRGQRPRDGQPADWRDFRVIVGVPHDLPVVAPAVAP
jgi:starch phosphorylase